jgi:hypothetical protein
MWWFRNRTLIEPYIVISSVLEEPVSDALIKITKNKNKWNVFIHKNSLNIEFCGSICTVAEYVTKKLDKSTIYSLSTNMDLRTKTLSHNELNMTLLDWLSILGSINVMYQATTPL